MCDDEQRRSYGFAPFLDEGRPWCRVPQGGRGGAEGSGGPGFLRESGAGG